MSHLSISMEDTGSGRQDRHLDETGNLALVFDAEAISQHVKQRTKTFEGEWFLNTSVGVPWLSDIFGQGFNPALAEALIKSTVSRTDGVRSIETFSVSFNFDLRHLESSNIDVSTIYDDEPVL